MCSFPHLFMHLFVPELLVAILNGQRGCGEHSAGLFGERRMEFAERGKIAVKRRR
jgi:hypothetical protein